MLSKTPPNVKGKVFVFYCDSYRDISKTRARFTLSDKHAGMTLGEIAAQAATSGECELNRFALSCINFVLHPNVLQPYEGLKLPTEAGTKLSTPKG